MYQKFESAHQSPILSFLQSNAKSPVLWVFLVLATQTVWSLYDQSWSSGQSTHGPFILSILIWLTMRCLRLLKPTVGRESPLSWIGLCGALIIYSVARNLSILVIEVISLQLIALSIICTKWGARGLRVLGFPLFFSVFLIPIPEGIVSNITLPAKLFLSRATVSLLYDFGYPVALSGASIHIAQYDLLVEKACSGLNSAIGLLSLGTLYGYLSGLGRRHFIILLVASFPIVVLANLFRVLSIVLITYYFGDRVGQGIAHSLIGVAMFLFSLSCLFTLDRGMRMVWTTQTRPNMDQKEFFVGQSSGSDR